MTDTEDNPTERCLFSIRDRPVPLAICGVMPTYRY
jgi:hypothetical protein